MKNNLILVTGGAGFLGSTLVPMLLEEEWKVRVFDNLLYGIDPLFGCFGDDNFEFQKGDIRDKEAVAKAVEGCSAVIHLACLVGYPCCKQDPDAAIAVNTGGLKNIIQTVSPTTPIIFASTGSCYGDMDDICTEELPLKPLTIYGETKAMAEAELRKRGNFVIFRYATAFGISPRMRLDLLINDFCFKAVTENFLLIYEKNFRRTFIHVADMARSFLFALDNYFEMKDGIFNVGSDNMNLTKQDVVELIKERIPNFYLHYADIGADEDKRDYIVSYDKMNKLGFVAEADLGREMDKLIELFKLFEIRKKYSNA